VTLELDLDDTKLSCFGGASELELGSFIANDNTFSRSGCLACKYFGIGGISLQWYDSMKVNFIMKPSLRFRGVHTTIRDLAATIILELPHLLTNSRGVEWKHGFAGTWDT